MIKVIIDYSREIILFFSGSISTLIMAFLTPYGNQWVAKRFARRPAFAITPAHLQPDLTATVIPLNRLACKNKNLNVQIGNVIFSELGKLHKGENGLEWILELTSPDARSVIMQNDISTLRLFFDADIKSEPTDIRKPLGNIGSDNRIIQRADNDQDLLRMLRSDTKIYTLFQNGRIDNLFPFRSEYINWTSILDGKELCIQNINNIEISGLKTALLHAARYAWVIVFKNCNGITLENLTFGHEPEGNCLGGVIKFVECSNINIKNCDLFGCGTYGLEFDTCEHVEVSRTVIRDCSYGIMVIHNSQHIAFSECNFIRNKEFDLIKISGSTNYFSLQRCKFVDNFSSGFIFFFSSRLSTYASIFIWENDFCSGNVYKEICNIDAIYIEHGGNKM